MRKVFVCSTSWLGGGAEPFELLHQLLKPLELPSELGVAADDGVEAVAGLGEGEQLSWLEAGEDAGEDLGRQVLHLGLLRKQKERSGGQLFAGITDSIRLNGKLNAEISRKTFLVKNELFLAIKL